MFRHAVHRAASALAAATASPPALSLADSDDGPRHPPSDSDDDAISLTLVPGVSSEREEREEVSTETAAAAAQRAGAEYPPHPTAHVSDSDEDGESWEPVLTPARRSRPHRHCTLFPVHAGVHWTDHDISPTAPLFSHEPQPLQRPELRHHLHLHEIEPPFWIVAAHYVTCGMFPIHQARIALSDTDSSPATVDDEMWHNPFSDIGEDDETASHEESVEAGSDPGPGPAPASPRPKVVPDPPAAPAVEPSTNSNPSPKKSSVLLCEPGSDLDPPLLGREPGGGVAALIADGIDDARVVSEQDLARLRKIKSEGARPGFSSRGKAGHVSTRPGLVVPEFLTTSKPFSSPSGHTQSLSPAFKTSSLKQRSLSLDTSTEVQTDHVLVQMEEGKRKAAQDNVMKGADASPEPVPTKDGDGAVAAGTEEDSHDVKSPSSVSPKMVELKEITTEPVEVEMQVPPIESTPLEGDEEIGLPPPKWNKGKVSRRWSTMETPPLLQGTSELFDDMDQKHPTVLLRHHAFHPANGQMHLYNPWPEADAPQPPGPHGSLQEHSPVPGWDVSEGFHPLYRRSSSSSSGGTHPLFNRTAGFHHQRPLSKLSRQEAEKLLGLGFTPSHPSTAWKAALALPPPTPPTPSPARGGRARAKSASSGSETSQPEPASTANTSGLDILIPTSRHGHGRTRSMSASSRRSSRSRATSAGLMMTSTIPAALVPGGDTKKKDSPPKNTPSTTTAE